MHQQIKDDRRFDPDQNEIDNLKDSTDNSMRVKERKDLNWEGVHEIQEFEDEEADLQKHFDQCSKSSGHIKYIPFETFKLNNLPEGHRDVDLFKFIRVVADLTVRIHASVISSDRPEFWPKSEKAYQYYADRGKVIKRTGTGQINEVIEFIDGLGKDRHGQERKRDYKTCICQTCSKSDKPSNVWWEIVVRTAAHVVFDDMEARETTFRLFYDSLNSPLVKFKIVRLLEVNITEDWCLISYVSCVKTEHHDQLQNKVIERVDLWKKVCQKFRRHEVKLTFIVSHPHGLSKQVSFGQYEDNENLGEFNEDLDLTRLTYSTMTCPGSSGAPVRCLGLGVGHVHSGTLKDRDLNFSGVSLVYRKGSHFVQ